MSMTASTFAMVAVIAKARLGLRRKGNQIDIASREEGLSFSFGFLVIWFCLQINQDQDDRLPVPLREANNINSTNSKSCCLQQCGQIVHM